MHRIDYQVNIVLMRSRKKKETKKQANKQKPRDKVYATVYTKDM